MDNCRSGHSGLNEKENDFEILILFLVEYFAVDADKYSQQGKYLYSEVNIIADVIAFEYVVDETIG